LANVLVVEDTQLMRESLETALSRANHKVAAFGSAEPALAELQLRSFDVVITDLKLPGMDGIELLAKVHHNFPDTQVVITTAYGTVQTAVRAMKLGAFDYIMKPFRAEEIEVVVSRALRHRELVIENVALKSQVAGNKTELIGESRAMKRLRDEIVKVASASSTVLIRGETGTGKELVARGIHAASPRAGRAFLCVNCAALSAGLLESELFGHEKGAFTGADRARRGRFELADGGTILLDEVSEIPPGLQAKLLRVLQEKEFERVGSSLSRKVDVRVLATTNRVLEDAVQSGAFRKDLFYRLNVLPVHVPPLRERLEDIPRTVEHFLRIYGIEQGRRVREISPEAIGLFMEYSWPGNVRELENIIERACVLGQRETILPQQISGWLDPSPNGDSLNLHLGLTLEEVNKRYTKATLESFGGHRAKTAGALRIGLRTLGMKIKRWDLAAPKRANIAS